MTRVLLARHGTTEATKQSPKQFAGWRDIPLTDSGRRQARDLASQLASERPRRVVTSPDFR